MRLALTAGRDLADGLYDRSVRTSGGDLEQISAQSASAAGLAITIRGSVAGAEAAVTVAVEIPGREPIELQFLLLDVNGTLSERGVLLDGVAERIRELRDRLEVRLLSADTFATMTQIASDLDVRAESAASSSDKVAALRQLGPSRCAAIGNGANDVGMLSEAALGIAVIGPEGASSAALAACDLVAPTILVALDLLRDPRVLAATLRR
jgi:soluble P-type ATPase